MSAAAAVYSDCRLTHQQGSRAPCELMPAGMNPLCVRECLIMCVKQPPHHDSAWYTHVPSSAAASQPAGALLAGKRPMMRHHFTPLKLHSGKLLFELDYGLKSLITESLQPEWQSSNKESSHMSRQLMNNNEGQDTIRVTES